MASCSPPPVPFLKPTGIESPEARLRWTWLSVVRAPIALQLTASAKNCGEIGSRNSQPAGSPSAITSSSSWRARCSPSLTAKLSSRRGSLMKRRQPPRVLPRGGVVVDRAGADHHQQPVVPPVEDADDLLARPADGQGDGV